MKKFLFVVLGLCIMILSGCSSQETITSHSPGIWSHYFVYPMSELLLGTAHFLGNNYGISIVLVTILVRVLILPLMLSQQKHMLKMQMLSGKMKELKEKYPGKDQESQRKLQQEMMNLYTAHGVNPFASMMPIFIQMPVFFAFYAAIRRTDEIYHHGFLWFQLGAPDPYMLLPILAACTTFVSIYVNQQGLPDEQSRKSMRIMMFIMPFMIFMGGKGVAAALSLYWVVSGCWGIIQSLYFNKRKKKLQLIEGIQQ